MSLVGRTQAIEYYRNGFDAEDLRDTQTQEDVYHLLSLIPESTDLLDTFLNLLGGGILGFYDPELDAFYLLDDIGGVDSFTSRTTVVHEFTHALQDQYYDLDATGERLRDDWDASLAFSHVVEGDAVATETAYSGFPVRLTNCFTIPGVSNSGTPYVIRRDLMTWYEDGYCFVKAVAPRLDRGSLSIFEKLPTTTEQILHPEKYLTGEGAAPVSAPQVDLGEGWGEIDTSTMGEYLLQNLLVLGLPGERPRVQEAAAGWGGGTWRLYGRDDARLIEAAVVWDTPADAQQFWIALADSVRARAQSFDGAEGGFRATLDGKAWRAVVAGDRVTVLVSTDAAALDRAAEALGLP